VAANPSNPAEPAFPATTPGDLARMSTHVQAYNEIIRRKAAQYGAATVDFYNTDISPIRPHSIVMATIPTQPATRKSHKSGSQRWNLI